MGIIVTDRIHMPVFGVRNQTDERELKFEKKMNLTQTRSKQKRIQMYGKHEKKEITKKKQPSV